MQDTNLSSQARRAHFVIFGIGVWLVLSPYLLHYAHTAATVNETIVGLGLAAMAFIRLRTPIDAWATWVSGLLGIWLVFSPFIFGYSHPATYWNQLLFGILIIVMALASVGGSIRSHSHLAH